MTIEELCVAAQYKSIKEVKKIIDDYRASHSSDEVTAFVNSADKDNLSPSLAAVWGNKLDILYYLLEIGADPSKNSIAGLSVSDSVLGRYQWPYEKRLEVVQKFVDTKSEIVADVIKTIYSFKRRRGITESDETDRTREIFDNFETLHKEQLQKQENLEDLEKHTKQTMGLTGDRSSETKEKVSGLNTQH